MDKLELRVRIFEFLYNIHFKGYTVVNDEQIDELVYRAIEITNKLYEEETVEIRSKDLSFSTKVPI